jgi:hypothetical protein
MKLEVNVDSSKVMKISKELSPLQIMINEKHLVTVGYFNCFGSTITNDAGCTREIKSRIAMVKATFNRKRTLFARKYDLNLRKKQVKCCCIWSIALYGAETWTLRDVDKKYLESFEMWCWRRMEKIIWTDHVR